MTSQPRNPSPAQLAGLALTLLLAVDQAAAGLQPPLSLEVTPAQTAIRAGEPIRFQARTNVSSHLYLYVTDPATGVSTLLLPNRRQPDNRLPAGGLVTVPGPELSYSAETNGVRQVTAVASIRPLDVTGATGQVGDLPTLAAKDLEADFASKGVVSASGHLVIGDNELVVRRFDLQVLPAPAPATPPAAPAADTAAGTGSDGIAFLAANRDRVRVGERLRVVFGADRQGYVHLLVINPGGGHTALVRQETDGRTLQSVETFAEAPTGDHALVAVYTQGPELDPALLDGVRNRGQDKGLRLVPDTLPAALAVRRVLVEP